MSDIPINNWLPLGMAAVFALAAVLFKVQGVGGHVWLAAVVLVVGMVLFTRGCLGGGVAKFLTASSLWLGPNAAFLTFVGLNIVGGFLFLLVLKAFCRRVEHVPYLPVMLFALIGAMPASPMWQAIVERGHVGV